LRLEALAGDAFDAELVEKPVLYVFPGLPDGGDFDRPLAEVIEFPDLGSEPLLRQPAGRQHDMRMKIPVVAGAVGLMQGKVHGAAVTIDEELRKLPCDREALLGASFMRQGDTEVARETCRILLGVSRLAKLRSIPQSLTLGRP
jgi:hypothetical protein